MLLPYADQGYMSRHTQARHAATNHAGQASGNPTVYMQVAKGYTTVLWQDGAVCCGLVFDLPLTACMHTLRHASGVI
jgi:hypothetical protein